jgi:hypothetical protein
MENHQDAGTNLQVTPKSGLPFASSRSEPAANGQQVRIELALNPDKLPAGDFQGHLELLTNDQEFPRMQIKVKGYVRCRSLRQRKPNSLNKSPPPRC